MAKASIKDWGFDNPTDYISYATDFLYKKGNGNLLPIEMDILNVSVNPVTAVEWAVNGGKHYNGGMFNPMAKFYLKDDDSIWSLEDDERPRYLMDTISELGLDSLFRDYLKEKLSA